MSSNILEFIKLNRKTLDLIMDLVPVPLFVKDRSGRYLDCNSAFSNFLSFSREEVIGKSVYEIWKKEEADVFFTQDNALFEQGGVQVYEAEISSADGALHIVQFHKQVFTDPSGDVTGFLGAIFDITERKKLEYTLAKLAMNKNVIEFINSNREILNLIMDLVPIPLFIKDTSGRYLDCNKAFSNFLSFSREEIIGKTGYEIWEKEKADVFFAQDKILFEQGGIQIYETEISSADGAKHIVQFHKQVFADAKGTVAGFLGAIFDITEKKKLEYTLAQLATVDELTGLPNRRDGMTRLEALHKDCERKERSYCIAMVDIDHFKRLNDQYGHTNGDLVLRSFADLAKSELRSSDVCFRYGGEEFVILLPETELDDGYTVVERLRQAWANNPLTFSDCPSVYSTVSIGLAQYDESCTSFEQLLQVSDKALYDAKNGGRNITVCIKPRVML